MHKLAGFRFYLLLLIIAGLALIPVFVLYDNIPDNIIFTSLLTIANNAGKILGLVGLATFAIGLILAARFVWMDRLLSDFTKILKVHRWLGVISFSLIIFHPIFLAAAYWPASSQAAWRIFWTWSETAYVFGYIAILFFMFLVVMTFFWRMKYERLKMLHSLLALPLMLGGLHALLIDSDVKNIPGLAWYYIILISLGIIAYLSRIYLVNWGIKSKKYIIESITQPTPQTVKIIFRPQDRALACRPGQFIFVSFSQLNKEEEHPFSVAGIVDGKITIVAKALGDFTKRLTELKVGGLALIDGPYGSFGQLQQKVNHQIWIAGGIGITPFLSLAQNFADCSSPETKVDLIYSVAKPGDFVDLEKLRQLEAGCPQLKIITHVSDEAGRLDIAKVKTMTKDFDGSVFCLCGPQGMVASFVKQLKKASIPNSRINIEAFELL